MNRNTVLVTFALLFTVSISQGVELKPTYPKTRKVDHVDEYHGVKVADPYRWLEGDVRESAEVRAWVKRQNDYTRHFLDAIPERKMIEDRITKLWNYPKYSVPSFKGGKYFFRKNDGLQNQYVLYVSDSVDGEPRLLLDPNTWSKDGTVALSAAYVSDDGNKMAYSVSEAGSDWKELKILNIESGEHYDETLKWIRWGGAVWNKAGTGFYYGRFPEPKKGQEFQARAENQMIYYHELGTSQKDDRLVYSRPDHPDWAFGIDITDDEKYLVMSVSKSTDDKNHVYYREVESEGEWKPLIDDFENQFYFVGSVDRNFFFLTDLDAPTKRIVSMSLDHPGRGKLTEIIPAAEQTLEGVNIVNHQFLASYLKDATTRVRIFDLTGKHVRDLKFPGIGAASGFGGSPSDVETFYSFSSYDTPPSTYRYDLKTGESKLVRRSEVDFDSSRFTVKQVFYTSKDGTKVPMFIAHRKDIELDGNNPTLLYAYGGFNISLTPGFSITYVAWMEMGGVVAIPNLRGGGEYGEEWHLAGKKEKKQNVFDDFIAAAEWLIENKYTRTEKLAIRGGSNGGLLVGAVMTQRPELFGACLPAVGVMDMLRFQFSTAGPYWVDEYGSSDDPEEFKTLYAYSPYHNIKSETAYPPTLVTTADTDDRVVPMHSFKFAARMQNAQTGSNPILIRIESRAGHGAGTPTSKIIENYADQWAFLVKVLNVKID